jgi:hypothetical protein
MSSSRDELPVLVIIGVANSFQFAIRVGSTAGTTNNNPRTEKMEIRAGEIFATFIATFVDDQQGTA